MVSILELILCDGRRTAAMSTAPPPVGSTPLTTLSLQALLEKATTLVPRAKVEDTLDGLDNRLVSESFTASRIRPPHSTSSSMLENTTPEQISSFGPWQRTSLYASLDMPDDLLNQTRTRRWFPRCKPWPTKPSPRVSGLTPLDSEVEGEVQNSVCRSHRELTQRQQNWSVLHFGRIRGQICQA